MDNNTQTLRIWENVFKNQEWGKYPPLAVVRFIARNFYKVKERNRVKILEIGSGPGANMWYMAREGFIVYGIDGSKTACKQAEQRLKNEKLESHIGQIKVGDYFDLLDEFPDEYFDGVIDVESLCCNSFARTKEIIRKAFDKLKPGGSMLSITFADGTWGLAGKEIDWHAVYPTEGPMEGKGFTRFTTREDLMELYNLKEGKIKNIEREERHLDNGKVIKEWIIELEKQVKN